MDIYKVEREILPDGTEIYYYKVGEKAYKLIKDNLVADDFAIYLEVDNAWVYLGIAKRDTFENLLVM